MKIVESLAKHLVGVNADNVTNMNDEKVRKFWMFFCDGLCAEYRGIGFSHYEGLVSFNHMLSTVTDALKNDIKANQANNPSEYSSIIGFFHCLGEVKKAIVDGSIVESNGILWTRGDPLVTVIDISNIKLMKDYIMANPEFIEIFKKEIENLRENINRIHGLSRIEEEKLSETHKI